ncbi:hypothetical protein GZH47_33090 (plasmid) [Paenibacillus rhizovicinus]|uniref:Uncharacterized protein n=1 Tax=Paenibacillus rhizovicinus TaxID=2704463 RepID=A0A6C0PAX6_9BACL|nr:hypothetical protein [Paenibacillus rhizovicinus]QHW35730.1 hypothetical protein GZH47_33090 [Paenibacillus rhizovicinus]
MRIIIDDSAIHWDMNPDPIICFLTGESTNYWFIFKNGEGAHIHIGATIAAQILNKLDKRTVAEKQRFTEMAINHKGRELQLTIEDLRTYYGAQIDHLDEPDYMPTELDLESHWLLTVPEKWIHMNPGREGIFNIAHKWTSQHLMQPDLYGYNNMTKGEKVIFKNDLWTIVMVSRMGDFGLSQTGELPYSIRVRPDECSKVPFHNHDCLECTYITSEQVTAERIDWYSCNQGGAGGTVIARHGSEGAEYRSYPHSTLAEAYVKGSPEIYQRARAIYRIAKSKEVAAV